MPQLLSDIQLGSIELFCLTAELGTFTLAAHEAGVTPAAVSRSVARLESRLGARLFMRSTRKLRLTDAGRAYFEECRKALDQLLDAERELTGKQIAPAGSIRMSLPTPYGQLRILPLLPEFGSLYPRIDLEVHLSNRNIDFIADAYDLAVRARTPPDSGLIARKLEDAPLVVVAASNYLGRAGTPTSPEDLENHECIQFLLPSSGRPIPWSFMSDGRDVEIATRGNYRCAEELMGGVVLARSGAGLYQTYRFVVEDDLESGALVEVLKDYSGRSRPFSVLYPHRTHIPLRVRVFIDFLLGRLRID